MENLRPIATALFGDDYLLFISSFCLQYVFLRFERGELSEETTEELVGLINGAKTYKKLDEISPRIARRSYYNSEQGISMITIITVQNTLRV